MAAGIGVIGSDTDGVKIHIKDRHNGILFNNSVSSIADTIVDVVKNGYQTSYIKEGIHIAKMSSWENIVKNNLLPVYKKLLLNKKDNVA